MKIYAATILCAICVSVGTVNAKADRKPCVEAESIVANLDDWNKIYAAYNDYNHCDDGAIAEGFSDSIVRMFSDRWGQLATFSKIASNNKKFFDFVVKHIDATVSKSDLETVIENSANKCPRKMHGVCRAINKKARKSLHELLEP